MSSGSRPGRCQPGGLSSTADRRIRVGNQHHIGEKDPATELAWSHLSIEPEVVSFFSDLYGSYPFDAVGGIVDWAPHVFYSLESQTKPNYWVVPRTPATVVHELAHQWFGDSISLAKWPTCG
jgi:hypothetical protein